MAALDIAMQAQGGSGKDVVVKYEACIALSAHT